MYAVTTAALGPNLAASEIGEKVAFGVTPETTESSGKIR